MDRLYPHLKSKNEFMQMKEAQKNQTDSVIRKNTRQKIIEKYLDTDSGLLEKMLGCGLLTWEEFDDIRTAAGSQSSKNEKLLNLILQRNLYERFVNLLKETQQRHLVEYENGKLDFRII